MDIEKRHIEAMQNMQEIDLRRIRAEKKLRELPQRGKIVAVREKRTALLEKREAATGLLKEKKAEFTRVKDEDDGLERKAASVQDAIDAAKGDYRMVESRAKELDGIAKRRGTLSGQLGELGAAVEQVDGIIARLDEALASIDAAEAQLIAAFQHEGGALQDEIGRCKAAHRIIAESLPKDVGERYEKTAARCGGVAMAVLQANGSCSACRASFDDSHLQAVRAQQPVATCPYCRRLIVVGE